LHGKTQPEPDAKSDDKTPVETQVEPDVRPLPESQAGFLREPLGETQGRSFRELEADRVVEFVDRTVVKKVAGIASENVKNNVQIAVPETVAEYVARSLPGFHDRAPVRTIDICISDTVPRQAAELEVKSEDTFVTEFVVRSVAGTSNILILTRTGAELSSMPMENESPPTPMKTRSKAPTLDVYAIK